MIRRATALDISSIIALLIEMHNNTEIPVAKINSEKLVNRISHAVHRGVVFVAIESNMIKGSIGGVVSSDWWSNEEHLGDLWYYVTPSARKSTIAHDLVKSFMNHAKENMLPVKLGHVYSGDKERKDEFFKRLGLVKAGSLFLEVA
tara:strand:- start:338 stop:775 length:438 start_codon:yes stop_codon:yes gene_type:complete